MAREKTIYVLYVPGGGLWGIHPAIVLSFIEEATETSISTLFNVMAGSSTGAILTASLNAPHPQKPGQPVVSAQDIVNLFNQWGPKIFPHKPTFYERQMAVDFLGALHEYLESRRMFEPFKHIWSYCLEKAAKHLNYSLYDLNVLKAALDAGLSSLNGGNEKGYMLADTLRSQYIAAYNLAKDRPAFFINRKANFLGLPGENAGQHVTHDLAMNDAILASSAAPTVFPSHTVPDGRSYMDLAIVDTPLTVLTDILKHKPKNAKIKLLFVDTGCDRAPISAEEYNNHGILNLLNGEKGGYFLHTIHHFTKYMGLAHARLLLGEENVHVVTKPIKPPKDASDREKALYPSHSFFDGRPDNMRKLNLFGHAMILENMEILAPLCLELFDNTVSSGLVTDLEKIKRVRERLTKMLPDEEYRKTARYDFNASGIVRFIKDKFGVDDNSQKIVVARPDKKPPSGEPSSPAGL